MSKIAAIIGRFLISLVFIFSGAGKLMDLVGTENVIVGAGLPAGMALPVAAFEVIGGVCLAAGFMVRLVSVLLAVFTAGTILFFHMVFDNPTQQVMLLKNLAIIGGLALAFAHSQMWSHYYAIRTERQGELVARHAEDRLREAELRAVKAEARADALAHQGAMTDPVVHDAQTEVYVQPYEHTHEPIVSERPRRRFFDW